MCGHPAICSSFRIWCSGCQIVTDSYIKLYNTFVLPMLPHKRECIHNPTSHKYTIIYGDVPMNFIIASVAEGEKMSPLKVLFGALLLGSFVGRYPVSNFRCVQ